MGEKTRRLLFILSVAVFSSGSGALVAAEKKGLGSDSNSMFSGKFENRTAIEALAVLGSQLGIRIAVVGSTAEERVSLNLVDCTLDDCIARILQSKNYIVSRSSPSVVEIYILNGSEDVSKEARSGSQMGFPGAVQPAGQSRSGCSDLETGCRSDVIAPDPAVAKIGFQADDMELWPPSSTLE